jgi:hypothetical protein
METLVDQAAVLAQVTQVLQLLAVQVQADRAMLAETPQGVIKAAAAAAVLAL